MISTNHLHSSAKGQTPKHARSRHATDEQDAIQLDAEEFVTSEANEMHSCICQSAVFYANQSEMKMVQAVQNALMIIANRMLLGLLLQTCCEIHTNHMDDQIIDRVLPFS